MPANTCYYAIFGLFWHSVMNTKRLPFTKKFYLFFISVALLAASCQQTPSSSNATAVKKPKARISFKSIEGIAYTEVRRQYDNGLGFNNEGYHLEPEWRITFLPHDSIRIFSLVLQKFIRQEVIIDHDSVANVAHSWLKVKKLSKDSIIFQVLYVKNKKIDDGKGQIYMKLYSNDYIKNVLHSTPAQLQIPPRRDSLFIQQKVKAANADFKKAFAAYEPVVLKSKVPQVTVTKKEVKASNDLENVTLADNYLSPTFEITIHKSYSDFDHNMQLIVDEKGKLYFMKTLDYLYDEVENNLKVMKGIVDGYLTYYLTTKPGATLGMPHASHILVHVVGIKD